MLRRKAFNMLKSIHLMAGQPNLAYKGIHPVIASHGHRPHRSVAYRQRYKTGADSAGGRTLSAPQTKVSIWRAPFPLQDFLKCIYSTAINIIF